MESGILFCDPDFLWHWALFNMLPLLLHLIYSSHSGLTGLKGLSLNPISAIPWPCQVTESLPTASSAVSRIKKPVLSASVTKIDWLLPGYSSRASLLRAMQLYQVKCDQRSKIASSDIKQGVRYWNLTIHNYEELLNSPHQPVVAYGTGCKVSRERSWKRKTKVKWEKQGQTGTPDNDLHPMRMDWNPHRSLQKFKLNGVTLVPFATDQNAHLAQKLQKLKDNPGRWAATSESDNSSTKLPVLKRAQQQVTSASHTCGSCQPGAMQMENSGKCSSTSTKHKPVCMHAHTLLIHNSSCSK